MAKKITGFALTLLLATPGLSSAASSGSSPEDSGRCHSLIREALVHVGQLDDSKKSAKAADFIHKAEAAKAALKYGECVDFTLRAKSVK